KHWRLGVHIADVSYFAPPGSALDREARKRGTSVYLPQRVIPMFPEIISNSLASLQQGKIRFVKSVIMDMAPAGQENEVRRMNAAIKVGRRFSYEEVSAILAKVEGKPLPPTPLPEGEGPSVPPDVEPDTVALLLRMRDLALILHKRRIKRGSLELMMPEIQLE